MNGKTPTRHVMIVPNSQAQKSLGKIRQEIESTSTSNNYNEGPYTAAATGLKEVTIGTYGAGNNSSPAGPNATAPYGIDEFSGYDHQATGGNSGGGGKIVCTMMNEFYGTLPVMNKIWQKHAIHMKHAKIYARGYHAIFLPLVVFAKKPGKLNYIVRMILEHMAVHRTLDVKAQTDGTDRPFLGRIYRYIFEPPAFLIGYISLKYRGIFNANR